MRVTRHQVKQAAEPEARTRQRKRNDSMIKQRGHDKTKRT